MTAAAFVQAARSFKGAKWGHRGRKPWRLDCVGLVAVSARKAGSPVPDAFGYGREPWDDQLRTGCRERWGDPLPSLCAQPGDVLIVKWGAGEPSHMGIAADHPDGGLSIIHAHNLHGVVEQRVAGKLARCILEVYRPAWGDPCR